MPGRVSGRKAGLHLSWKRSGLCGTIASVALVCAAPAFAHRGLAPWENGGPVGGDTCAQCHFDAEVIDQSAALSLDGLPEAIEGGAVYELTVGLADPGMGAAGFLLSAVGGDGASVGVFESDGERVEVQAAQARSTVKAAVPDAGAIAWRMAWTAPEEIAGPIRFYLSANAANDDQSAFGDTIHLKTVER